MKLRISQRDLAKIAGVSPMTVSLALRHHPSIPPKTRDRIRELAAKNHYRPDAALAALNAYRIAQSPACFHGTLGWLTSFPDKDGWKKMIQVDGYYEGICQRAEELGYRISEFWIHEPGLNAKRLSQILINRNVQGLIAAPLPNPLGEVDLEWENFCAVALGYSLHRPKLHVVMNNQFRNMKQVTQRLYDCGYRRIGLAMPSDERIDHNYLGGFFAAQWDFPPEVKRIAPLVTRTFVRETFLSWLKQAKPDVVIVSATKAYKVIDWLKEIHLRVPEDIGLAVASVPYTDNVISGIDEKPCAVGGRAVDYVVAMIHHNERGIPAQACSVLLEGIWKEGKTTRPQPEKRKRVSAKKKLQPKPAG